MRYTEEEIEFLKTNYPIYGGTYCKPHLRNRSTDAINATARRLGLRVGNKRTHPDLQAVSIDKFRNITEDIAYFLGYFWSDGYIYHYISNGINNWKIVLEIQEEDAIVINPIMKRIGNWSIQKRKRNDSWKTTWSFTTNNKDLYNFLLCVDYKNKSTLEPTKILRLIPNELHLYFWKGMIDGDGSIGLVGRGSYLEMSSTYDYKYTEFEKYISTFEVRGAIYKQISKKGHKSSVYKIYGKKILKLEHLFIDFGLQRKTNKFNLIKQKYANK